MILCQESGERVTNRILQGPVHQLFPLKSKEVKMAQGAPYLQSEQGFKSLVRWEALGSYPGNLEPHTHSLTCRVQKRRKSIHLRKPEKL